MELFVMLVGSEPGGLDPEIVKPGWLGLIVILVLAGGLVVLARSFAKHARRAARPWEGEDPGEQQQRPEQDD